MKIYVYHIWIASNQCSFFFVVVNNVVAGKFLYPLFPNYCDAICSMRRISESAKFVQTIRNGYSKSVIHER